MANLELKSYPHPGEIIREYLDYLKWTPMDLAKRTGLSPEITLDICEGRGAITAAVAAALEKALGRPAHFWLNLQALFDHSAGGF